MSAFKELYLAVKAKVEAIPEIKHYDYWNSNVDRDDVRGNSTPAVFFEYSDIIWTRKTENLGQSIGECSDIYPPQRGELDFTLHIVFAKKDSSAIDASELLQFDIVDSVYKAVNHLRLDRMIEPLYRLSDLDDNNNSVLRDWQTTFRAVIEEDGDTALGDTIVDAAPVGFDYTIDADAPYLNPM